MPDAQPSLRRRLLNSMLLPAASLAIMLGAGGALLIHDIVETTHDRLLDGSVRAIAEHLTVDEDDAIAVDLPPVALGMLESEAGDQLYYSVSYNATLVSGYPDLLRSGPAGLAPGHVLHRDATVGGRPVRLAALARRIYGRPHPLLVEVAETRNGRSMMERELLSMLALLEAVLLAVVGLLTWIGIGRGLRPLQELGAEIRRRAADGAIKLHPLPTSDVPQELLAPVLAFNVLLQRLDRTTGVMLRFTADASHQMQTPLTTLRMQLALLRRQATPPQSAATLDEIDDATSRLERLFRQLLRLARADEEALHRGSDLAPMDLAQVTAEVLADAVPQALARGLDVVFEPPGRPVMVLGNSFLASELLANLIENAIHYNRPGGAVLVIVTAAPGTAWASIEDEGPGISQEQRSRVFERFYRVPQSGGHQGSGLGLAIVASLAERMAASVTLEDRPDGPGLRVTVRFAVPPDHIGGCGNAESSVRV